MNKNRRKQTKVDESRRKQIKVKICQKFEEMENSAKIRDRIEHFGELEI